MSSYTDYSEHVGSMDKVNVAHPRYLWQNYQKTMFTMNLLATSTGVAAGNIASAAAAASTNFALTNPSTSNKNLVLTKFMVGVVSGTPGAGPIFHGYCATPSTVAGTATILSNVLGNTSLTSVATGYATAAGTTLTGCSAPVTFRVANFSSTATAQASVGLVNAVEELDGDIIIPPGVMWVPLWSAGGSSLLNAYSVTWYEMGL